MSLIINFSQIFKNKSNRKRNFIIYHFLVESKPHERIDLLITASMKIYQTKKSIPILMKTFLKEKWWNNLEPPFLREPPFWTNPFISEQFFHNSHLCLNFKSKNLPLILWGGGNYDFIHPIFRYIPSFKYYTHVKKVGHISELLFGICWWTWKKTIY